MESSDPDDQARASPQRGVYYRIPMCCLRGCTESDTTEATQQQQQQEVFADFRTRMHSEGVNKVSPSSGQSSTFEITNSLKLPVLISLPNKARDELHCTLSVTCFAISFPLQMAFTWEAV